MEAPLLLLVSPEFWDSTCLSCLRAAPPGAQGGGRGRKSCMMQRRVLVGRRQSKCVPQANLRCSRGWGRARNNAFSKACWLCYPAVQAPLLMVVGRHALSPSRRCRCPFGGRQPHGPPKTPTSFCVLPAQVALRAPAAARPAFAARPAGKRRPARCGCIRRRCAGGAASAVRHVVVQGAGGGGGRATCSAASVSADAHGGSCTLPWVTPGLMTCLEFGRLPVVGVEGREGGLDSRTG